MKLAMFLLIASFLTGMGGGCCHRHSCHFDCGRGPGSDSDPGDTADASAKRGGVFRKGDPGQQYAGPQYPNQGPQQCAGYDAGGPPSAAVTYPYYTTRGPRDFFMNNPRNPIGP